MKMTAQNKKKTLSAIVVTLLISIGTYNAVVINSDSNLASADMKFVKRLDEMNGKIIPGRATASVVWTKLDNKPMVQAPKLAPVQNSASASVSAPVVEQEVAAIQEELNLNLTEVTNPKKWAKGLTSSQFSGSISTSNGVIESLTVSLPDGESVNASLSELTGNVFKYDVNGDTYSGLLYKVDVNSYMVTLSDGPLEGSRLRFTGELSIEQAETQEVLASEHNVEVGTFGQTQVSEAPAQEEVPAQASAESQTFNF